MLPRTLRYDVRRELLYDIIWSYVCVPLPLMARCVPYTPGFFFFVCSSWHLYSILIYLLDFTSKCVGSRVLWSK